MSTKGDVLRLQKQLETRFGERELRPQRFRATMGNGTGAVKVPGKPNYVYVRRLGRGLIEECLNNKAAARDGLPIIAGYSHESPETLQVLEVDWFSFSAPGAYPYTQHHHEAHELHNVHGGDDVVWVQSQQIMPLLVYPTNPVSMRVNVFGGWYPWASGWHYFENTLSADLTAHVPALPAEARYVLISIDGATEALQYTAGAAFPIFLPPVDAENMVPIPPIGSIPIGAIYLPFGTTALDWDNLYDMRLFNQPTGGSITPGAHALLDTSVHNDTATNAPTRGSIVVGNATPAWDKLVHPAAAGYALTTDANDIVWDQTPTWTGEHSFEAGIAFVGASGANEITVPDDVAVALELLDAGGLEYARVVSTNANPYFLIDPAGAGIKVGIGAMPNQQLTVEGTIDLKEQAAANPDTAAYGQIWVKNTTPNELWFTDDAGTDVQLGVGGGALPAVAGAGYALVSDGVNSWVSDQTPAWTGEHSFAAGVAFVGASGVNEVTVPDNIAIALELLDAGGLEYLRIVSTNANPYVIIDPAAAGIKVGIGTTTPTTAKVHIKYAPGTNDLLRLEQITDTPADNNYIHWTSAWGPTEGGLRGWAATTWGTMLWDTTTLFFSADSRVTTHMTIKNNGCVGIPTTTPTASLHITGTVIDDTPNVEGIQMAVAGNYARIEMAGSSGGLIDFSPGDGTDFTGRIIYVDASDAMSFYTNAALAIAISNAQVIKLPNLAGVGVRNVVAAADGTLSAP